MVRDIDELAQAQTTVKNIENDWLQATALSPLSCPRSHTGNGTQCSRAVRCTIAANAWPPPNVRFWPGLPAWYGARKLPSVGGPVPRGSDERAFRKPTSDVRWTSLDRTAAPNAQISVCSEISRASSTSMPR